jgi:predicted RNase H-like nuclease (RuvC/YqgF family)
VVALIGVVSAWLSARAARNAAKFSADASTANEKAKAETDAYHRARKMDIETIERQDAEIRELIDKVRHLEEENRALRTRVAILEGRRR